MVETLGDPRTYFKFTSCSMCLYKPCDGLRYGGVRAGKFIIVHNSHLGSGFFDCPFVAQDFDEIRELLDDITFEDLLERIDDVLFMFTPAESVQWRQEDFFSNFGDIAGRVEFLKALWDDGVISVVRIPRFFMMDAAMRKWLYAYEGLIYMLKKPELADDLTKAAVTDAMAGATTQPGGQDVSDNNQDQDEDQYEDQESPTDGSFSVRLNIDPNDPDSQDDTFTLFSTDDAKTYSEDQTVKDDQVPGDSYTDLTFTDMDTSLSYSLKIDRGKDGEAYFLFENKPFEELHG